MKFGANIINNGFTDKVVIDDDDNTLFPYIFRKSCQIKQKHRAYWSCLFRSCSCRYSRSFPWICFSDISDVPDKIVEQNPKQEQRRKKQCLKEPILKRIS